VAVAPSGNVYVSDTGNDRVQYFDPTGSFLGKWGSSGAGDGLFSGPVGISVAPGGGKVYVVDWCNYRVQYFTALGYFMGKWGSHGSGEGQFDDPRYGAISRDGCRLYVTDSWNHRVQYFRWTEPAVAPASLGSVKALFR
jgi:DNA-binding beta-propeller fold protein YncE